jgi:hypothetical protein
MRIRKLSQPASGSLSYGAFTAVTGVRIPVGTPATSGGYVRFPAGSGTPARRLPNRALPGEPRPHHAVKGAAPARAPRLCDGAPAPSPDAAGTIRALQAKVGQLAMERVFRKRARQADLSDPKFCPGRRGRLHRNPWFKRRTHRAHLPSGDRAAAPAGPSAERSVCAGHAPYRHRKRALILLDRIRSAAGRHSRDP